jgi:hypothetical protein
MGYIQCSWCGDVFSLRDYKAHLPRCEKKPGPTGQFPRGKLHESDEGELRARCAVDREKKVMIIDFGKPVTWLALDRVAARAFIDGLLAKVVELEKLD